MLLPTNSVPLHAFGQARSVGQEPGPHSPPDTSIRLPNGRTQREEILKADYEKTRQEAAELVKLAEQLQEEIQKNDRHVLSVATLKKAEDIEKLAKRIRSRMRK
ncbi:MAG: hypothetical protein ACREMQ_07030 [Longimicrobiales bacterium]